MQTDPNWKDKSDGDRLQYEFVPPPQWSAQRRAEEQAKFAALIEEGNDGSDAVPAWLRLVARLPTGLRAALALELRNENEIGDISSTGWPHKGSVVVTVCKRFRAARKAPPPGVEWRQMNCPQYWREHISEQADGIDFIILT